MDNPTACTICGKPIEAGEAWMESGRAAERLRIHAGCLYGEARANEDEWQPQEHAAS